jgi:fructoselysine-6-P-deglycase FrlB-like protein
MADIVVTTDEQDQSWCHTVGYLSPILVGAAVAAHITNEPIDPSAAKSLLADGLSADAVRSTESMASALAGVDRLIVTGSGADRAGARELVLKVEEGAHLAAAMRDLETGLHGHLAGMDGRTGRVLILTDSAAADARAARAAGVLRAAAAIGVQSAAILGASHATAIDTSLTPAGRVVVPDSSGLRMPPVVASIIGSVVPLQLLTERLARERSVNPDPIRRDDPAYLAAADAAG